MLIAHLSDLHLRDGGDVRAFEQQLDRIAARHPAHLAITGDLLDRWDPDLLERALAALASRGFLAADRLTLLHGNHDLASGGGHPRRNADLWRLAVRFWDPPPLVRARRRRFYSRITDRAPGVAARAPWIKTLPGGWRIAVLDTIPLPWAPFRISDRAVIVQHAVGCTRPDQARWLRDQKGDAPLVLLIHHLPLGQAAFHWQPAPALRRIVREVRVPMEIPAEERAWLVDAAAAAGVRLVLCGHVHRARLEWHQGMAVGLNGQSGAAWAGRTIAYYDLAGDPIVQRLERGEATVAV